MFTPRCEHATTVMFTSRPNAESIKALLRAVAGAEREYCGFVAHHPWWIMDGARELIKAVCEACNGCSVGDTLIKIRQAIERGERPALKITCPTRDLYHITAATDRWTDTRMVVESTGPPRNFFKRFEFKFVMEMWNAGRAAARPGALKDVPLTADEHKKALLQADAHCRFMLHLTSVDGLPLINGQVQFCDASALLSEDSVDTLTADDANAPASAGAFANFDGLPASDYEALTKTASPPVVQPGVAPGEFYDRSFRLQFPEFREARIYLLKQRGSSSEKLRWLIKVDVAKDAPEAELLVRGMNLSTVIETEVNLLVRLDAGE
jgi:hypothetical protein